MSFHIAILEGEETISNCPRSFILVFLLQPSNLIQKKSAKVYEP